MEFTGIQRKFINDFVIEINNGDAAIFAGAGLSSSAGFVNWKELLRDLAEEIKLDVDKENDLVAVAQYHFNKFKRGKINSKIINEFSTLTSGTRNHQILALTGIDTFWTTNYDTLIEKTLEGEGKLVELKIRNEDFSRNIKKKDAIVYKMHGDKNSPDEAILIKDDYDSYNDKREFFTTTLRGDLLSKTFLFIGFSFDDPNLDYVISRIKVLLKDNTPTHYCFMRTVNEDDFEEKEDFLYAKIKQDIRIEDLLRYGINVVPVEKYSDITAILEEILKRILRRNIFVSGAAAIYSPMDENAAKEFVHKLSYKLAEKNYKIVSGYGLGIGSMVINGALDYKLNSSYKNLDDLLILRPFPQIQSGKKPIKDIWTDYRKDMISKSGIAIFMFGNKEVEGKIVESNGMLEEFSICIENNVIPVAVGMTGYVAKNLWDKTTTTMEKFYPDNRDLRDAIFKLGDTSLNHDEIITNVLKAVSILQKI